MFQPDSDQLRALLSFERLIPALKAAFIAGATVPLRHTHAIGTVPDAGISLLMPAWDADRFYGVKIVNIFPANAVKGLPGLHATYVLHDARTGVPLALLDGNEITSRRTAAAAALAASFLARPNAACLLVVGAGRVGSLVAPAMAVVRALADVAVWDIDSAAATRCADALLRAGFPAHAVTDIEAAVRGADIISCATLATRPLIQAEWLQPGSHLDLIGSFTPAMTEAAPGCFAGAGVWVDTDEATAKSGDLLNALSSGDLLPGHILGDLTALCRGKCAGRTDEHQRTVFKAVGTALEDLAAAKLAFSQRSG